MNFTWNSCIIKIQIPQAYSYLLGFKWYMSLNELLSDHCKTGETKCFSNVLLITPHKIPNITFRSANYLWTLYSSWVLKLQLFPTKINEKLQWTDLSL